MPELPEVETTRKVITPYLKNQVIKNAIIYNSRLRWPIPLDLPSILKKQQIKNISRRGKYLLFHLERGYLIMHLGMSGRIILCTDTKKQEKHDHFDLICSNIIMRFNDPRRFGAVLFTKEHFHKHVLLKRLGPEPLSNKFDTTYLFKKLQGRTQAIKLSLMDHTLVAGIGNIYANEALFDAGIYPLKQAKLVQEKECKVLVKAIKKVMAKAIKAGGTTLKNFHVNNKIGYFQQQLHVYMKAGLPCIRCKTTIKHEVIGQRSTYYCPSCQN